MISLANESDAFLIYANLNVPIAICIYQVPSQTITTGNSATRNDI
jgi:hypothetical protein